MAEIVRRSCTEAVFIKLLRYTQRQRQDKGAVRFDAAVGLVVVELARDIRSHYKKANRKQRIALRTMMKPSNAPDGIHDLSDRLQSMAFDAISEAHSQVDVSDMAIKCWNAAQIAGPAFVPTSLKQCRKIALLEEEKEELDLDDMQKQMKEEKQELMMHRNERVAGLLQARARHIKFKKQMFRL